MINHIYCAPCRLGSLFLLLILNLTVSFLLKKQMSTGLPPLPGSGKVKNVSLDSSLGVAEVNPFRLPGDDHVFRMREEEVNHFINFGFHEPELFTYL